MIRPLLAAPVVIALAVAGAALPSAPAQACTPTVVSPRLAGETDEQLRTRTEIVGQARLRALSETVFVAEISSARRVGAAAIEWGFTPVMALYDTRPPETAVTTRLDKGNPCGPDLRVGELIVIYAARADDRWNVIAMVPPDGVRDWPRDPALSRRAIARGTAPMPVYPD